MFASDGDHSIVIYFGTAALLIDLLFMVSLPTVGLMTCAFSTLAMGGALILTDTTGVATTITAMSTLLLSIHFATFNFYHMFATRRLRTRKLKAANETIEVLLGHYDQHGSDWLVEIDRHGRLVRPSQRMCEALGRPREAVEGMDLKTLIDPGPELREALNAADEHKQISNHLLPARVHGEQRWWSISGCPIYDSKGEYAGYRAFVQDVTEKHAAENRVRTLALTDGLTGLANRAVFRSRLEKALAAAAEDQTIFGVLFIDLDSFKVINDTLGHAAGDEILCQSAERIAAMVKPGDTAARFGGDEFALILSSTTGDCGEIVARADALSDAMARPFRVDDRSVASGASIGVAIGPRDGADGEALLRAADLALYEAKALGRGRSVEYQPALLEERAERRALEADLRNALDRGEFLLHYQPLIDIKTRGITGYEALLRWNHPVRGSVPPAEFIPIAEQIDIINPIGEWVLREALKEAATWRDDITIAVNVSPAQMRGEALLAQVINALASSGVAPERLELEITENLLMQECDAHVRMMHRLRTFGVKIALDDFGTGYSSLNYLRSFPFDKLKIDRSFVKDLTYDGDSRSIVEMLLRLGRNFSMKTIAEGVEHEGQFAALEAMGCEQVQGFMFGKPVPASSIPPSVRKPATAKAEPSLAPVEWLKQNGCAGLPAHSDCCKTACRKC
ncbi:putative bifunctional diguanylate cyclase/phosphodiesterase [Novosphingobium aquimarinum]|uniref:putative bifunctional diguanylate cyclase/phosphodiesterase n=1 Tax=Novosphingobium aquimarinum TaxID=2682494 RepID=UPI0018DC04E9|nr:EAL domain-containing protein [Novosphingobium aquimarinum]